MRGAVGDGKMAASSTTGSGGLGDVCKHHAQLGVCESRAKYREGRRPRAVKVGYPSGAASALAGACACAPGRPAGAGVVRCGFSDAGSSPAGLPAVLRLQLRRRLVSVVSGRPGSGRFSVVLALLLRCSGARAQASLARSRCETVVP